jgi:hypothetical protein
MGYAPWNIHHSMQAHFFLKACKFTCCTVLHTAEKAPEAAKHSTPVIVARKTTIIEPI